MSRNKYALWILSQRRQPSWSYCRKQVCWHQAIKTVRFKSSFVEVLNVVHSQVEHTIAASCRPFAFAGAVGKCLVFASTKRMCEELAQHLQAARVSCAAIHGDKDHGSRRTLLGAKGIATRSRDAIY